jgi:hypothetical protein
MASPANKLLAAIDVTMIDFICFSLPGLTVISKPRRTLEHAPCVPDHVSTPQNIPVPTVLRP